MTVKTWKIVTLTLVIGMPLHIAAGDIKTRAPEKMPHYSVQDLGTLGGAYSLAFGLNNAGIVAGGSATASQNGDPAQATPQPPQTGFLWKHGHMRNLGTLGGPNSSAGGPNASGEAALISETTTLDPHGSDFCAFGNHLQCLGAIWKNGKLKALALLPGGYNAAALGLNDRGQVIGHGDTDVYDPDCAATAGFQFQSMIWEPNGRVRQLSPLPGDTVAFGFGINNRGQAVGGSGVCANTIPPFAPSAPHAVLWDRDGTPVDLGSLGGPTNIAASISNRGDIAGTAFTPNGSPHAFLWTRDSGRMRDLGTVPGFVAFVDPCCNTINDRREIVGFMLDADFNSRAFYYSKGNMVNLNSLLSKEDQREWILQAAESINESGQITGYGLHNDEVHAFLATPCHHHDGSGECCEDHER